MNIMSNCTSYTLKVNPDSIERFTTLLQSGVEMQAKAGEELGAFLARQPGFTMAYILDRVQTIFLNGNAIDDLHTPLTTKVAVIAISAAMPGLAGAIFRKNSLHAALRTVPEPKKDNKAIDEIQVHLKLFNMIAKECGVALFQNSVIMESRLIASFFNDRPTLLSEIYSVTCGEKDVTIAHFLHAMTKEQKTRLIVETTHG